MTRLNELHQAGELKSIAVVAAKQDGGFFTQASEGLPTAEVIGHLVILQQDLALASRL